MQDLLPEIKALRLREYHQRQEETQRINNECDKQWQARRIIPKTHTALVPHECANCHSTIPKGGLYYGYLVVVSNPRNTDTTHYEQRYLCESCGGSNQ